jgi:hypothetical protein
MVTAAGYHQNGAIEDNQGSAGHLDTLRRPAAGRPPTRSVRATVRTADRRSRIGLRTRLIDLLRFPILPIDLRITKSEPVSIILGSLADGMTPEQIRDAYPQLTLEDIQPGGLPLPREPVAALAAEHRLEPTEWRAHSRGPRHLRHRPPAQPSAPPLRTAPDHRQDPLSPMRNIAAEASCCGRRCGCVCPGR